MKHSSHSVRAIVMAAVAVGGFLAFGEATYTTDESGNFVFDLSSDDTYGSVLSGSGGLVKKGVGKLKLTGANTFTGDVRVEAGTLAADTPPHFGQAKKYTVLAGATIDISSDADGDSDRTNIKDADITISGTGVNGGGAIRRTKGADHFGQTFRSLYLDADATVHATKKYDFLNIHFQNHVLTKTGTAMISGSGTHFYAGGDQAKLIVIGGGSVGNCLNLEGNNWFDGGTNNVLELRQRGRPRFWKGSQSTPIGWTLYANAEQDALDIVADGNSGEDYNWWSGPVVCEAKCFRPIAYSGRYLHFMNTVQAPEIVLQDSSGLVHFMSNVTSAAAITVNSGCHLRLDGVTTTGGNLNSYGTAPTVDIHGSLHLGADANLAGRVTFSDCPTAVHTTMKDWHIQANSRVEFLSAGLFQLTGSKYCYFHSQNYNEPATLVISNTCVDLNKGGGKIFMAPGGWMSPKDGCATLEICKDSIVTGIVAMANVETLTNANVGVYQTGGTVVRNGLMDELITIDGTIGHWGVTDGRILAGLKLAKKGRCSLHLGKGASVDTSNEGGSLYTGGGDAEVYLKDGASFNLERPLTASVVFGDNNGVRAGRSVLAVRGTGTRFVARDVMCRGGTAGLTSVFAVSAGGSFACRRLGQGKSCKTATPDKITSIVSFDGGILKPLISGNVFWTNDTYQMPDTFVIHDGGLIVDTSDCQDDDGVRRVPSLGLPIRARVGRGLKSVSLPTSDAFLNARYYGAPRVTVTGTGTGAVAVCEYDMASRRVTGITVVSPGWGYGADTSVTVASPRGTEAYACTDVTLTEATCGGGLTKRGSGELAINLASSYTGETVAEGGTLTFSVAGAYPGGNIRLAGGEICLKTDTTLACTVRGNCADIFSGTSRITCDGTLDVSGVTFEITDPENLSAYAENKSVTLFRATNLVGRPLLAGSYGNFGLSVTGTSVRFGNLRGLVLLLR